MLWCECASTLLTANALSKLSLFLPRAKRSRQTAECECTFVGDVNVHMFSKKEIFSPDLIEKSFKKCGISNKLDGMDDDYLWDSDPDQRAQWTTTTTTKAVEKNICT
jgi:hypothetical protein